MTRGKTVAVGAAALIGTSLLSACSSHGGTSATSAPLTYATVSSAEQKLTSGSSCPFAFDLEKAATAAGLNRAVHPGSVDHEAVPGHPQTLPSGASMPPGMTSLPPMPTLADITCSYTVGDSKLDVLVLATDAPHAALNVALPIIVRDGRMSVTEAQQFVQPQPAAGAVALTPGDGLAAAAVPTATGDVVLVVSQASGDPTDPALRGTTLKTLTTSLLPGAHLT